MCMWEALCTYFTESLPQPHELGTFTCYYRWRNWGSKRRRAARSFPCHPGWCHGSQTNYSNQLMPEQGSEDEKPLLKVLSMMIKSEGGISCTGGAGSSHQERISDLLPDWAQGRLRGKETEKCTAPCAAPTCTAPQCPGDGQGQHPQKQDGSQHPLLFSHSFMHQQILTNHLRGRRIQPRTGEKAHMELSAYWRESDM